MIWNDCKSNPPKKSGRYIVCFYNYKGQLDWTTANYCVLTGRFLVTNHQYQELWTFQDTYNEEPIKWVEVDLEEVLGK